MHGAEEVRVAQHVANLEQPPAPLRRADQRRAVLQRGRHRLLQQYIIAGFQRGQRRGDMLVVLRGDDHRVGQPGPAEQRLPGGILRPGRQVMLPGEARPPLCDRFRHRHELQARVVLQRIAPVDIHPALPGADER